jgi:8-oxo-dGTP pyrophosphatase MutT (NUDIX family)
VRWTVHGERTIYDSPWMRLALVDVDIPGHGRIDHHVLRMPAAASGTVVHDADRGVLLLWRHRFITDTWGWEIPAGRVDRGETLEEAGVRETIEETGWRPLDLDYLGFSQPTIGLMEQRFEYFEASRAEQVGEFDRTETESIAWFAPDDVRTLIEQSEIVDGLTLTALGIAFALRRL